MIVCSSINPSLDLSSTLTTMRNKWKNNRKNNNIKIKNDKTLWCTEWIVCVYMFKGNSGLLIWILNVVLLQKEISYVPQSYHSMKQLYKNLPLTRLASEKEVLICKWPAAQLKTPAFLKNSSQAPERLGNHRKVGLKGTSGDNLVHPTTWGRIILIPSIPFKSLSNLFLKLHNQSYRTTARHIAPKHLNLPQVKQGDKGHQRPTITLVVKQHSRNPMYSHFFS